MGDIRELGKVLPSPRQASDKANVLLNGPIPKLRTNMKNLPLDIPSADRIHQ